MKTFKLVTHKKKIPGPDILGVGAARKELAAIVRSEKIYAGDLSRHLPLVRWSDDRLSCVITYNWNNEWFLWDRYTMEEKGES